MLAMNRCPAALIKYYLCSLHDRALCFMQVIFRAKKPSALRSFAMPFVRLRGVELEQPIFGSNYLKGRVFADPDRLLLSFLTFFLSS